MSFLPQTKRDRWIVTGLLLLLCYIGVEIKMGAKYAARRDSDFRAFRWDSKTLWKLKKSYTGEAFGERIVSNSASFRGTIEYPVQSKHRLRIITFGDSRTYGFSVADNETYSAVLESQLREKGFDAEAINAGTHGFGAVQCRARLEELLRYKPAVTVFAPGYNDRRYLVVRPADSDASFRWIARGRRIVDVLQWSNVIFGLMTGIGTKKLKAIEENPPGLDEVTVRVPEDAFRAELERMAIICGEHEIKPVFLKIHQEPGTFGLVENAARLYERGELRDAIGTIEDALNTIPDRSYSMSRYYLGQCYRQLGDEAKARQAFANHRPLGSIFGESVLRSQHSYFSIIDDVAEKYGVPAVDGRAAIVGRIEIPHEADAAFRHEFVDECHYTPEGHLRMGRALAEVVAEMVGRDE